MLKVSRAITTLLTFMLTSLTASAADMHLKAPPAPPPPPPFSWSGFYIGGEFGGVSANGTVTDSLFGLNAGTSHDGFIGGGDVGFNWQTSNIVFGVDADFDWTSLSATGNGVFIPTVGTLQGSANTNSIATVAGRLGVATVNQGTVNQILFYVKGGGGWVRNTATITNLTTGASVSTSNTNSGWLFGAGIEWAFLTNWSLKFEYNHLGLSNFSFNSVIFPRDTFTASRNLDMLTIGLNYRFDWGNLTAPVTARF